MAETRVDREQKTRSTQENAGTAERDTSLSRRSDYAMPVSPFDMFRRVSREMDRLFGTSLLPSWGLSNVLAPSSETLWNPQMEMFERDGKLIVRADLPGLSKDDVKIELRNDALIIEGKRNEEHEEKDKGFYHSERTYGEFYRAIPLPEGTSAEHPNATFRNGVLEITLAAPKRKDLTGRRIEISEGKP